MTTTAVATQPASVQFTEEMLGHVTFGETDFNRGSVPDRPGAGFFKFHLTIVVDDIQRFGIDPMRQAGAFGWVECDALGGRMPVERGVFNLFVDSEPGVKHMLYRLFFRDGVGHPLTMTGYKLVRDDAGFDVWRDTTTLFTRVLRGHVEDHEEDGAELVASGVLRIRMRDFAKQLTTFRAHGKGPGAALGALVKFGWIFLGQLAEAYVFSKRQRNGQADQG
jgi:cholesterol oxidase